MNQTTFVMAASVLTIPLVACNKTDEIIRQLDEARNTISRLEAESTKWRETANSLQETGKQVAEKMVQASDSVDPIAVKEIFRDYKSLAEVNEKLRQQLASSGGPAQGDINLVNNSLKVIIKRYSGGVILDGWIADSDSGKFYDGVTLDQRPFSLEVENLAGAWVTKCYNNPRCANRAHEHLGNIVLNGGLADLHAEYQREVDKKFANFLLKGPHTTPENNIEAYIEGRLLQPGKHSIKFKAKPMNPGQTWSVVVEIGTQDSSGKYKSFHEVHMNSANNRTEPDPINFYVRFSEIKGNR